MEIFNAMEVIIHQSVTLCQVSLTTDTKNNYKGKDAVVLQILISLSQAIEPVGGYTTESVTHSQTYNYLPSQWPVPIYTAW